jgi:phthiocerol/phenolphthiocerol synthesis type-I polyketide synthase D
VVAHEIACQLIEQGHQVGFLGMFDTHNPAAPTRRYGPFERLAVFWTQCAELPLPKRIGLLASRVREGIMTHRSIKAELRAAAASGPAGAYTDLRRVQVREENWRAMLAYQPRPFPGHITLFKTTHTDDKVEYPADYGWSEVARDGLDIVSVSGRHLDLFNSDNIASLADTLNRSISRSAHLDTAPSGT